MNGYELHVFHSKQCGLCTEQLRLLRRWSVFVPIYLVDVDKAPDYEKAAGIIATPTSILLHFGAEKARWIGLVQPAVIAGAIDRSGTGDIH